MFYVINNGGYIINKYFIKFHCATIIVTLMLLTLIINPICAEVKNEPSPNDFYDVIIDFFAELEIFNVTELEHFANIYAINTSGPIISSPKARYYTSNNSWKFFPPSQILTGEHLVSTVGFLDAQTRQSRIYLTGMGIFTMFMPQFHDNATSNRFFFNTIS